MELLFTSRFIDIAYLKEKNCLIQTWKGYCSSEEFRDGQQKTVRFFIEKGCSNFISDTTNAGLLKKEDTDWVTETITPQLVKGGMKDLNLVLPSSAFTKMTLMNLEKNEKEAKNAHLKLFGSIETAIASLEK